MTALISVIDLALALSREDPPTLLDIRFSPVKGALRDEYDQGHIPGARFIDVLADVAHVVQEADRGSETESMERWTQTLSRAGVDRDRRVVVYGGRNGVSAGYAVWALRWAGHPDVRLLDGGLDAWRRAGGPLVSEEPSPGRGTFRPSVGHQPLLERSDLLGYARRGQLVDARATSKFAGESASGHIPGAVNLPTTTLLDHEGRVGGVAQLRDALRSVGVDLDEPVGFYCGAGIASSFETVIFRDIGVDARIYPGGWEAWTALEDAPRAFEPQADVAARP